MKVSQGQYDLNGKEFDLILIKSIDLLQMEKEFTSTYVVHYKINTVTFLKYEMHLYNEGMFNFQHD